MSYDLDEDILQDFLIEAGEILELLSEQLVELDINNHSNFSYIRIASNPFRTHQRI